MASGAKKIFLTKLTDINSTDKEGVGCLRWEGNKCYKYVKFLNTTATVAGAAGNTVVYTAVDGYDDNEVCMDVSDADAIPIPAGQVLATITGTAGTAYYGWIQIKGFATHSSTLAASLDGTPAAVADGCELVKVVATDLTLRRANDVIDAAAERALVCGVAVDASAKTIVCDFPF